MTNTEDPLDGADIGETVTVDHTEEMWVGDLEPAEWWGSDRYSDTRVVETEVVTNEHGEDYLQITIESDVTKTLPHRWDALHTDDAEPGVIQRHASDIAYGTSLFVTTVVMTGIVWALAGVETTLAVDGEPVVFPTFGEMFPAVLIAMSLIILVQWVVTRVPRMGHGRGVRGGGRA